MSGLLEEHLGFVRSLLRAGAHDPRHSLGQHFLLQADVLRRIAGFAGDLQGRTVLEVGPGPGGLTAALLEAGAHVVAFEIDDRWSAMLRERFDGLGRLRVVAQDAMAERGAALRREVEGAADEEGGPAFVANLPYQVASPLLIELFAGDVVPRCAVAMVQKEVADRIVAPAGSSSRGLLSVLLELRADARRRMRLAPGAFLPPPKVDSAVVEFRPRSAPIPPAVRRGAAALAREAFGTRRKMLRSSLRRWRNGAAEALDVWTRRPQELDCATWCALAEAVHGDPCAE